MFKYEVHSHDTRAKNKIYTYQMRHDFARKNLSHNVPLLLNDLSEIVKEDISHMVHRDFRNMLNYISYIIIK